MNLQEFGVFFATTYFNPTFQSCIGQDKVLEDVLLECCELVGRFVVPESYLPHMLPRIREEPEVNPAGNR